MIISRAVKTFFVAALAGLAAFGASPVIAADGASIIMYHRFGENDFPTTNVRLEQLDAHIKELTTGGYTVLPVPEIVRRLKSGEAFDDLTVGITIDDAYLSVLKEAWPRFKRAGLPFTVFVATEAVDKNYSRYMSWAQLGELSADPLVSVGSQTASHLHMIDATAERNAADVERSQARFQDMLGFQPDLVAYPYGEFDGGVVDTVKQAGFKAGFGQHSGAFGAGDDLFRLPRFAMNENYGDVARLKTAASAQPIPVSDFDPVDTVVSLDNNPPLIGFTVPDGLPRTAEINCFSNHEGKLHVEHLGPRVEVRMTRKLPQGRTRMNCTMPTGPAGEGRFRWLGRLFYVK